jgi:hypothetical protein
MYSKVAGPIAEVYLKKTWLKPLVYIHPCTNIYISNNNNNLYLIKVLIDNMVKVLISSSGLVGVKYGLEKKLGLVEGDASVNLARLNT